MCPSSFVRYAFEKIASAVPFEILDIPAGTGRNSLWLAGLGHRLTIADIDGHLVRETQSRMAAANLLCTTSVVDACGELPFQKAAFDAVVIVDFVNDHLLKTIGKHVRPGGWLVFESYAARGKNWRQLPPPGVAANLVTPCFDIVEIRTASSGPTKTEAETVKLLARKRVTVDLASGAN